MSIARKGIDILKIPNFRGKGVARLDMLLVAELKIILK